MAFTGTFNPARRPTTPPPIRLRADEIPDACRAALLGFLRGVAEGWGKRKLAHWLIRAYGGVALMAPIPTDRPPPRKTTAGVDPRRLLDIAAATRDEIIDVMLSLSDRDRARAFALDAALAGWVTEAFDERDQKFWIPVDLPGLGLQERLLSLVAADYLARPTDYETKLAVCNRCDAVAFDERARFRRLCRRCGRRTTAGFSNG